MFFARFHQALYDAGPVTAESIARAAASAGVTIGKADDRIDEELSQNIATASQLGMSGTPGWVIGDRILAGAQPLEELQGAVAASRAR